MSRAIGGKPETQPDDIIRSALGIIHHDALIQHRAITVVVLEGWSSACIGMIRTLLDLLVPAYAILNSSDLISPRFATSSQVTARSHGIRTTTASFGVGTENGHQVGIDCLS